MAERLARRGLFRDGEPAPAADAARALDPDPWPRAVSARAPTRGPLHSLSQTLELIFCFAPLWEISEQIEAEIAASGAAARPGRKRRYPIMMLLIWDVALWDCGSARAVERELKDPLLWQRLRRAAEKAWPDHPNRRLPRRPISRSQYHRGRERHLRPREAQLTAWAEDTAAEAAAFMGILDPAAGDVTHPPGPNTVYGDATWVKALFAADPRRPRRRLDAATGELSPQRCDPDARAYNTRTGSGVGHQAVLALARNPHPGERVILAAFLNHPGRSDATAFTDKALELANRRPGRIAAAAYDGALHAADMIRLLDNAITPIAKTRRGPGGTPAAAALGPHKATLADGTKTSIDVTAIDGTPAIAATDAAGKMWYIPLTRNKTRIRRNKTRPAAVYTHWRTPDTGSGAALAGPLAGAAVTIRHNPPDRAQALRINQALRAIPPSDPDYDRLYGLREDAESANSHLKERLRHSRAHTTGRQRLQLNLTGYQIHTLINALANWQHRTQGDTTRWFGQHQPP